MATVAQAEDAGTVRERRPSAYVSVGSISVPVRVEGVLALVAVVPLVLWTVLLLGRGWTPQGDEALLAIRVHDVFSAHPPLTGMRSTSSSTAPDVWAHHPGPLQFYLLAPLYALTGWWPGALLIGSLLLVGGFVLVAVVGAHRAGGRAGAVVVALVALATARVGGQQLVLPLNIWPPILGLLAVLVLAWLLVLGRRRALLPYVFCASVIAQGHIAMLPVVAVLTLVLAGVGIVRLVHTRRTRSRRLRTRRFGTGIDRDWRRSLGLAALLAVLCWLPVIVEPFVSSAPNLPELWRLSRSDGGPGGVTVVRALEFLLSNLVPLGPHALAGSIHEVSGVLVAAGAVVVVLAAVAFVRPTRSWMRSGLGVALTAYGTLLWATSSVRVPLQMVYSLLGMSAGLLVTGLVGCWLYDHAARRVRARVLGAPVAAVVACLVALGFFVLVGSAFGPLTTGYGGDVARASSVVRGVQERMAEQGLLGRPTVVEFAGSQSWVSLAPAVMIDLEQEGSPVYFNVWWPRPQDDDHRRTREAPADAVRVLVRDRIDAEPWAGDLPGATTTVPFQFEVPSGQLNVEVLIRP
ncbi:hypothetical protein PZ938_03265 [Luteipulveratus sp. YIM 133132]|uniref:hypothetical protein n=1 Tax=Luteipulveratus flavus TaxID=3031728 RepID=UPI0023AFBC65|nr:hypothetical protein [Luteipulveratus sp. YIM 133132]MDE9364613.1 hypothetical protein [Luteipulveratus sp. YIM 133132]